MAHITFLLQQELQYTMINVIEYVRQLKQYESLDVEALNKDKADLATVSKKNREEIETLELQYPKLEEMAKEMKLFSNVRTIYKSAVQRPLPLFF